jgi:hypothetical protein
MSGFLIIKRERSILCLSIKELFLKKESALSVALDVISFNYILDIDSFILCLNYVFYKLGIQRV